MRGAGTRTIRAWCCAMQTRILYLDDSGKPDPDHTSRAGEIKSAQVIKPNPWNRSKNRCFCREIERLVKKMGGTAYAATILKSNMNHPMTLATTMPLQLQILAEHFDAECQALGRMGMIVADWSGHQYDRHASRCVASFVASGSLAAMVALSQVRLVGASRMQSKHLRHWGLGSHGVPSFWSGSSPRTSGSVGGRTLTCLLAGEPVAALSYHLKDGAVLLVTTIAVLEDDAHPEEAQLSRVLAGVLLCYLAIVAEKRDIRGNSCRPRSRRIFEGARATRWRASTTRCRSRTPSSFDRRGGGGASPEPVG